MTALTVDSSMGPCIVFSLSFGFLGANSGVMVRDIVDSASWFFDLYAEIFLLTRRIYQYEHTYNQMKNQHVYLHSRVSLFSPTVHPRPLEIPSFYWLFQMKLEHRFDRQRVPGPRAIGQET